ncbi:AraC family transcriptional regulator [Paenibacillus guangzhouensis]|uniref:AraC family transcriptional regulator n=1 Tax=Paenibacillus guangzhouensis TaxID=1473112 RepID=UPI00187B5F9A|nr:AraC family transcriptional regulator [Paenibacillus guangzhouensis]
MEALEIGKDRTDRLESVVDEVTNATLMEFPVQCAYRTTSLVQPTLHSHRGYELYLCVQGEGHFIVGERVHELGAGTFTVIKPMAWHRSRPHKHVPFHRYILTIESRFLEQLSVEDRECAMTIGQWLPEPEHDSIHLQLNPQQVMRLQEILAQLEGELMRKLPCYSIIVKSLLLQLFAQLNRYQIKPPEVGQGGNHIEKQLVENIISYMMEHYDETLSAEKLCEHFYVSRSYFFRIFKHNTGITMNEFLVSIRMTKAKELLRETDLPIIEIAGSVGFQDVSHFCNTFKRLASMTPSRYRTLHV